MNTTQHTVNELMQLMIVAIIERTEEEICVIWKKAMEVRISWINRARMSVDAVSTGGISIINIKTSLMYLYNRSFQRKLKDAKLANRTKYSRGSQRHTRNVFGTGDQMRIRTEGIYSSPHYPTQTQWRRTHALVVVILRKIEKSQQLFNEHELLGLAIRVEVQKNSRLIGHCHRCQRYGHAQCYCTAPPKCLKCASDHMTHLCPLTGQEERKYANCGGAHPANSPSCRFTPRRNLEVIAQRRSNSYAEAAVSTSSVAPTVQPTMNTQNVDLATALRSLQQIISPLISETQALQAIFPQQLNG
ncbi:unnamed protein product [Acanthoscelides obtectus]|uniref:Nucleic-acid-binding protein from mobile element jockey n=1 Tax=Acanthoscelides obtectus TaxID=200917 RepID=A0A9P0LCM7_ACAOB|nr:unnamed protein product [Acanthoscelides obtectus]CAK1674249.1 Nucleic-acid-binding protein from transposon X-element [Acanthoscelides obtectus]